MPLKITKIPTKGFSSQKPGTSGLRKKTSVFQEPNYTENYIQSLLTSLGERSNDSVLVIGGDGRFLVKHVTKVVIKICGANQVGRLIVGKSGILSTPAVSNLIRRRHTTGGIILTASHNAGGPDKDFGIKFNISNGGPAPDTVMEKVYQISQSLSEYNIVPDLFCDIESLGTYTYSVEGHQFTVDVIDPIADYVQLMKDIFDFDSIRELLRNSKNKKGFKILIDSMNGVTGPYVECIFHSELGADKKNLINTVPLEDFGGLKPDPNITNAARLVEVVKNGDYDFGAAFDGDGDRHMILGSNAFFVTPSDSLAVLSDHLHHIKYFRFTGVKGFARSMPTAPAVDRVAQKLGLKCYEVPTGWKHFGVLMDSKKISICGEESFGMGSDHIREKDGIWAVLAWLQVIACENKNIVQLVRNHWKKYGRNFFVRLDYETLDTNVCERMLASLEKHIASTDFPGTILSYDDKSFVVKSGDNYNYIDSTDGTVSKGQGLRVSFEDGSRIVYRKSGTGSVGCKLRIYVDKYEPQGEILFADSEVVLQPLIEIALELSKLHKLTGRKEADLVISG